MITFLISRRKFVILLFIGLVAMLLLPKTLFAEVLQDDVYENVENSIHLPNDEPPSNVTSADSVKLESTPNVTNKEDGVTFDFTHVSIENGNYLSANVNVPSNEEGYIKLNLVQGKSYFYEMSVSPAVQIISPSGVVLKQYPRTHLTGATGRVNPIVSNTFEAKESGIYTVYLDNRDWIMNGNSSLKLYELVNSLDSITNMKINDGGLAQIKNSRVFAVSAYNSDAYLLRTNMRFLNPPTSSTYGGVKIHEVYQLNKASVKHMDDYRRRGLADYKLTNNTTEHIAVYNRNPDVYVNLVEWYTTNVHSRDLYAEIKNDGHIFTPKTGDAAKEKLLELNAQNRESSLVADPVDAFAGNFVDQRTLLSYSGNNPLAFSINYDSIANESIALGGGFTHNFETHINENETGLELYWSPNSRISFTKQGDSYYPVNPYHIGLTVIKTDEGYLLKDKDKQEYIFNAAGKLVKFTNKMGLSTSYIYSANLLTEVVNDKGQFFLFTYNDAAQLSEVEDRSGRKLLFTYSNGRLINIQTPKGYDFAISYVLVNDNYKVSTLSYNGVKLVENRYDSLGRVNLQYDGKRNGTSFKYDEYTDDNIVTTTVTTGSRIEVLEHNKDGYLLSKTDGEGFTERYSYDHNGNVISKIDKNEQFFTYQYDENNRLVKEVYPNNTFSQYAYDQAGNITVFTTEDGLSVNNEYENGRLLLRSNKLGNQTIYNYDSFGNVTRIQEGNKETLYTYDSNGYLQSITIEGKTTTFENDVLGRVLKTTLPDGSYSVLAYDEESNIIAATDLSGNATTYEYNAFGDKITETDTKGNVTYFSYDNNGNLISEKSNEREIVYTYNAFNEVTSKSLKNGTSIKNKETYTYDKRGQLIKYVDADNIGYSLTYDGNGNVLTKTIGSVVETYTYDNMNNLISSVDGNGGTTTYNYDVLGNVIQEVSPNGATQSYSYDAMNRLVSSTNGEGYVTTYEYDAFGNLIKETKPNDAITSYEYNEHNQLTATINALGERSQHHYNDLGQLIEVRNALNEIIQQYEYTELGQVNKITDGNGHSYSFEYDSNGNLLEIQNPLGHIVEENTYNQYDELIATLDALGNTTTYAYDLFGNVSSVTDPKGNPSTFTYSAASRLRNVKDPIGTSAEYKYDTFGNISSLGQTSSMYTRYTRDNNQNIIQDIYAIGSIKYGYDLDDNLVAKTNARNQTISYEYDKNGQVIKETSPEGITTFTYDSVGNVISIVAGTDSIIRTYDLLGRVTSKTQNGKTISYEYDVRGHLTKVIYPDGKAVHYTYDVMGNMLSVTDWYNRVTTYSYDENNQLIETINSNGTKEVRAYDAKGQLVSLQNLKGTNVISSYVFEYDANGNIVKENDLLFSYDTLNRLTLAGTNKYSYSSFGSITEFTVTKDGSPYNQKMTYGNDSELKRVNNLSVIIDKDGNLETYKLNGKINVATYDSKNRLIFFDGLDYGYDAENNRVRVGSTDFVIDNDSDRYSRVLIENEDIYHVYGNGLIGTYSGEDYTTYHYDYRGSVTSVTDSSGAVIGQVTYDEYGVILSKDEEVETRFLYNGKYGVQTDKNGLYYMRARYYNPDLKRFMNRDVVTGSITEPQSLNRYAFVNGNPVSFIDPFGLARETANGANLSFSDWLHIGLDGLGLVPVIGEIADGANALFYLSKGDYTNATISAAGMIPFVGSSATVGRNVVKYGDDLVGAARQGYKSQTKYAPNYKHFTAYEYKGFVKVGGVQKDVSRRVYQRHDIDWNKLDEDGITNLERIRRGNAPVGSDGNPIELHHLIQKEPGTMVEVLQSKHSSYYDILHSSHGNDYVSWRKQDGGVLDKQYNNFRKKYWKDRYKNLTE